MQFQTETISLEIMLGAIQHYTWEQAWGLSNAVHSALSSLGIRILPSMMMYLSPPSTSNPEITYHFPVPPGEKRSVDRLQAALFNLDTDQLQTLNTALKAILQTTTPINPNTIPKKIADGSPQNILICLPSSLIYPEIDYSALENDYKQRTPQFQREADELIFQANKAKQEGNLEASRRYVDEAVRLVENAGEPTFDIRVKREQVLNETNIFESQTIRTIWEEALDYYRRQADDDKICYAIGQLTAFSKHDESDKQRSLDLMDEAIQIMERMGQNSLYWRRKRNWIERIGRPYDPAIDVKHEIELAQQELEYEKHRESDATQILQIYLNLNLDYAQIGDNQQAERYLDEAEKYLNSITEEDITRMAEHSHFAQSTYQIKYLLLLRAADIQQRRNNPTAT